MLSQVAIPTRTYLYDRIRVYSTTVCLCLRCDSIPFEELRVACHNLALAMSDYLSKGGKRDLSDFDAILSRGMEVISNA